MIFSRMRYITSFLPRLESTYCMPGTELGTGHTVVDPTYWYFQCTWEANKKGTSEYGTFDKYYKEKEGRKCGVRGRRGKNIWNKE